MKNFLLLVIGVGVLSLAFGSGVVLGKYRTHGMTANLFSSLIPGTNIFAPQPTSSVATSTEEADVLCESEKTATAAPVPPLPKVSAYKLLRFADDCAINKLSTKGWTVAQAGGIPETLPGGPYYAADCRQISGAVLDWVLMEKDQ